MSAFYSHPARGEDLPALAKYRESEEAYRKAREAAAKELDAALAKLDAVQDETRKLVFDAKDKDARAKASEKLKKAGALGQQLRLARQGLEHPHFGPAIRPSVHEELRLGARLENPGEALRAQLKLEKGQGLVITAVEKDRALARAGLQVHDVLVQVNDKPVPTELKEFRKLLATVKPDTAVTVVYLRHGKQESAKEVKLPAPEETSAKNIIDIKNFDLLKPSEKKPDDKKPDDKKPDDKKPDDKKPDDKKPADKKTEKSDGR